MSDLAAALAGRLARLAADGETIGYGALAAELAVRVADLTAALEALMEDDAAHGEPLRAALLSGKLTGGLPARGFYEKAAALGFVVDDPALFVAVHRERLGVKYR